MTKGNQKNKVRRVVERSSICITLLLAKLLCFCFGFLASETCFALDSFYVYSFYVCLP